MPAPGIILPAVRPPALATVPPPHMRGSWGTPERVVCVPRWYGYPPACGIVASPNCRDWPQHFSGQQSISPSPRLDRATLRSCYDVAILPAEVTPSAVGLAKRTPSRGSLIQRHRLFLRFFPAPAEVAANESVMPAASPSVVPAWIRSHRLTRPEVVPDAGNG